MYEEFKEPLYFAPPLLLRMVDAGLLGKKSGPRLPRLPAGRINQHLNLKGHRHGW